MASHITLKEVEDALKKHGTAQNRKIYQRHGATGEIYGVSFGNLKALKKELKVPHELAEKLWNTGVLDCMIFAAMIADPKKFTKKDAEKWIKDVDDHMVGNQLTDLIVKCDFAKSLAEKWMPMKKEYYRHQGYFLVCSLLKSDPKAFDNDECVNILETIVQEIHQSENRARNAMNYAVISIGIYKPELTGLAITSARKIGEVKVDHGDTNCKTPDAVSYIRKSLNHKHGRSTNGANKKK